MKKSKFPDVTALYFLLMLVAIPMRLWAAIRFLLFVSISDRGRVFEISPVRKIYSIAVVSMLMCVGF
ncbi:hypothetical protein [Burkholderia ambifaria]|uniref:hypothetical protein n=1 Tax=Burkholderia ambifaria TaxID=152480 RepID=UPI00158CB6AD|nr:hypothetical protein [Burkholderia ambifaria]